MTVLIAIIASLAAVVIGAFLVVVYRVSRTGGVSIAGYRISRAASGPEALPAGLQLVIDAIPAVVSCKDRDGRIVLINAYTAALFGASPAEILGRRIDEFQHGEVLAGAVALDRKAIDSRATVGPVEQVDTSVDGKSRTWLVTKVPQLDAAGAVDRLVTVAFDVTDRKRVEESLIRSANDAEAASRAKATFLATMSHELRTPLNAIIGFSDMINAAIHGPVGSPKYQEYARDVAESGRFLLSIINDILDLSKIEAGQMILNAQPTDLAELLQRCSRLIEGRARQGSVELMVNTAENLPAISADPRSLTQIIVNLLSNAVKFTNAGGEVRLDARLAEDGAVEIAVVDTGIGMSEEDIATALRPFEQIDRGLDRQHEGTGLGLPIVKGLVELHGGTLDIRSEPGEGTTVTVRLPRDRVIVEEPASSGGAPLRAAAKASDG
ncbi:MAG: PAS domain-containing protein [Alphaproteobacteria bacterium]|nr:PAS domain-containing protein [Alphaproteobacteria bacterium]